MSIRHLQRRALLPLAGAILLMLSATVAGCAGTGSDLGASTTTTTRDLAAVTVNGPITAKPTISVPTPFAAESTARRVLQAGTGPAVKPGQRVTVQYVGINGTDGKEFDTSWSTGAAHFVLTPKYNMPGLVTGLVGVQVGSRVLLAIPPRDGYGVKGLPSAGIGPTDTLVIVVDVQAAHDVLTRAQGTPVVPKAGLPIVKLAPNGAPTITVPRGTPPGALVAQPLIVGKGPAVKKSQKVLVQYTGVIWATGRVFDSSWKRGEPAQFPIGVGQVISGWDIGLVGQPVGSQVMLVVPPDQGYGAEGKDSAGIRGTDVLVFVIDILDAA